MKTQLTIRRTILAMAIAGLAASGSALAVGSFDSPQALEVGDGGSATVSGTIGTTTAVDFYSFVTKAGNRVTIDIDGTHLGSNPEHDIAIYVFDGMQNWLPVQDSDTVDAGSQQCPLWIPSPPFPPCTLDPAWTFDVTSATEGTWKVAVASSGRLVNQFGQISQDGISTGPYTLTVLGLPVPVTMQTIDLDIKPGSKELSVLNPKSKGVIPVALLWNKDVDPFDVEANVENLRFGAKGDEKSFVRCLKDGKDVNGDGKLDRICHFDNEKAGFGKTSTMAKVKGKANGKTVEGSGFLKVVPQKHKD
jgi:hypothetical protein